MKKIFGFLVLVVFCNYINSQSVNAGDTLGMHYESINKVLINNQADSIDITQDGIPDIVIYSEYYSNPYGYHSGVDAASLNPKVKIAVNPHLAKRFDIGDNMTIHSDWMFDNHIELSSENVEPGLLFYGEWLNINTGYLGFRIEQETDTLYGWIQVFALTEASYCYAEVIDFAIETNSTNIFGLEPKINSRVFPNPASDYIRFETENNSENQVEIFSVSGKKVASFTLGAKTIFYTENLADGLYLIVISNTITKESEFKKIVVNHN